MNLFVIYFLDSVGSEGGVNLLRILIVSSMDTGVALDPLEITGTEKL